MDARTGQVTESAISGNSTRTNRLISTPVITNQREIPTIEVIVALQPIDRGSAFTVDAIGRREWPVDAVPPDVLADETETIGKTARRKITFGEVIVRSMLIDRRVWKISSSPIVHDEIIYFERYEDIYASDIKFNRMWNFPGQQLTIAQNTLYYYGPPPEQEEGLPPQPPSINSLYAVDAVSYEELWRFDSIISPNSGIVTDGGVVYFSAPILPSSPSVEEGESQPPPPPPGTSLIATNAKTGEQIWQLVVEEAVLSTPAVADGAVYVTDTDGNFYAVDIETGQEKWGVKP